MRLTSLSDNEFLDEFSFTNSTMASHIKVSAHLDLSFRSCVFASDASSVPAKENLRRFLGQPGQFWNFISDPAYANLTRFSLGSLVNVGTFRLRLRT